MCSAMHVAATVRRECRGGPVQGQTNVQCCRVQQTGEVYHAASCPPHRWLNVQDMPAIRFAGISQLGWISVRVQC